MPSPKQKNWFLLLFKPFLQRKDFAAFARAWASAGKLKKYLKEQKKSEKEIERLFAENMAGNSPEQHALNTARIRQLLQERANNKLE